MELWGEVLNWWNLSKAVFQPENLHSPFEYETRDSVVSSLNRLAELLIRVVIPKMKTASDREWADIFSLVTEVRKFGVYLTSCLPYVLIHRPKEVHRVSNQIADDLNSELTGAASQSAKALRHWFHLSDQGHCKMPPKKRRNFSLCSFTGSFSGDQPMQENA